MNSLLHVTMMQAEYSLYTVKWAWPSNTACAYQLQLPAALSFNSCSTQLAAATCLCRPTPNTFGLSQHSYPLVHSHTCNHTPANNAKSITALIHLLTQQRSTPCCPCSAQTQQQQQERPSALIPPRADREKTGGGCQPCSEWVNASTTSGRNRT